MYLLDGESLLTMSDNSTDPYDVRNELKMDLILLNRDLKKLDKDLDFSAVLRPLLEDSEPMTPLLAQIDRLRKLKDRMTTVKDDFLRQEQERKEHVREEQEQSRPAPPPAAAAPKRSGGGSKKCAGSIYSIQSIAQDRTSETPCIPQKATKTPLSKPAPRPPIPELAPIEPQWGPLKRYTAGMTWKTYEKAVKAARWLYGQMWSAAGGPASLTVRALDLVPESEWPSPPLTMQNIKSYLGGQIGLGEREDVGTSRGFYPDTDRVFSEYGRGCDQGAAKPNTAEVHCVGRGLHSTAARDSGNYSACVVASLERDSSRDAYYPA